MIGSRLGPYEIAARLGEGGMGGVCRATDIMLKRDMAIKVLPQAFTEDRERFGREAQLRAQLHRPNIAPILKPAKVPELGLLFLFFLLTSCNGQPTTLSPQHHLSEPHTDTPWIDPASLPSKRFQISQYIRRMFQDKAGNIWFGTNDDGVCRYDGKSFIYFNEKAGFSGNAVRGILQDGDGNLWFATSGGVTRYAGNSFTNFTAMDGLSHNDVWSMLRDRTGNLWFGTVSGVSRYDGHTFASFPIPAAEVEPVDYPTAYRSPGLVWCILEDRTGNLWFGTNGRGVSRYDGNSFTTLTEKEGLSSNFVWSILEDKKGNLWFGTSGGLCRYDGKSLTTYSEKEGLSSNRVWTVFEDKAGILWLGTAGGGLCRYDGKSFTHYSQKEGLGSNHVQSILQDRSGNLWFGTSGGVYRYNGETFTNFTKEPA